MPQPLSLDLYQKHFFEDADLLQRNPELTPQTVERIVRCRGLYSYWKRYPSLSPADMVNHDMQENPNIKHRQAQWDIWVIKQVLGAFEKDTKEWHAYNFNKEILNVYKRAMDAKDYRSAEKALADYAKYNQLDKGEDLNPRWEDIMPKEIEPTDDATVAGLKPLKNLKEKIKKYNQQYSEDVEDASFEEVTIAAKETGELKDGKD